VTIIVGDRDPCRQLHVEPLRRVRPDWPEQVIPGAGHLNCLLKPEFEQELEKALEKKAPTTK
jgi:hypothetical protein